MTLELSRIDLARETPLSQRRSPLVGLMTSAGASAALWALLIYAARQVF